MSKIMIQKSINEQLKRNLKNCRITSNYNLFQKQILNQKSDNQMQAVRKKRDKLAREIRSKQRSQKMTQKRESCFGHSDDGSLVLMIFYMIEKETNLGEIIDQETFERFLDMIDEEFQKQNEMDRKINERVTSQLIQKYRKRLETFQELVLKAQLIQRLSIFQQSEGAKMFDFIRFLFRIQVVNESLLEILDAFLEAIQSKISQLCESNILQINFNFVVQELTKLTQLKIILLKQISYLHYLMKEIGSKNNGQQSSHQFTNQNQIIQNLVDKWICHQLLFEFTFNSRVTNKLKGQKSPQTQNLNSLVQDFFALYLQFIYWEEEIIVKMLQNQFVQNNPQKFLEVVFGMFFILDDSFSEKQIEISDMKTEEKQFELFLFVELCTEILKRLRQNNEKNNNAFLEEVRQMIINCFGEWPKVVVEQFFNKNSVNQRKEINQIKESSGYFVSENLCDKIPLVVRLFHEVEEMYFDALVNFVQLLAMLTGNSDALIETMLRMEEFKGSYGHVYNFKILLDKFLIGHINIEVQRRGLWLLSNITGSEQHYSNGFYLIEGFFVNNFLEQDYALTNLTKEELLVKELMIQTIMNYLSNMRQYGEIKEMMEIKRPIIQRDIKAKLNQNQQPQEQHLLGWVMGILSSVLRTISQSQMSAEKQRLLQILIYSLYNLLTLELNRGKFQNQTGIVVLILMERLEIPKYLELIYHRSETSHNQSRYFSMLETLLDLIEKAKRNE